MLVNNVTIGADPELFIINKNTGKVVSSIGIIPGEKGNPWRSDDMPVGFGLEIDNILAEFNIPPTTTCEGFINNIQYMKDYIEKYVSEKNPSLGILCASSMMVDPDQLRSKEAKLFGCDPDYNVYTESENPKPKGERTNLRSAGFHIHIGYSKRNIDTSLMLVRYMDALVGLNSVLIDSDTRRRSLYGKAGSFRLQPWGVEYRTLSSYMMKDKETLKLVWNLTMKAIYALNDGWCLPESNLVISAINSSNRILAEKLIDEYNLGCDDSHNEDNDDIPFV